MRSDEKWWRLAWTRLVDTLRASWNLLVLYVAVALLMVFFIPWFLAEVTDGT